VRFDAGDKEFRVAIFYLDYENGNDATTATPLGWWSVSVTPVSGSAPTADETMTGATSGATAKLTVAASSWSPPTPVVIYFYGKSGTFQAETVNFTGGGSGTISADLTYCAWKTITTGATADRIAPGDVIRIAKSPAPVSIGDATWTNLSKTVTLASAQNATVDLCETAWTATNGATVTRQGVATDAKQGSYCMQITAPASPATSTLYAYYAITATDFSAYQKLSFWLKNEVAVSAENWKICLCSDNAGATIVDTFQISAIPSAGRWLPLTLARVGGGNLGASIQSIALYSDTVAPTASKYIRVDDFIACATAGLNLQSLISKNSAEQGGTEGWYGIQSIVTTTVLLDSDTNTLANTGRGYSGTTGTVATYKRETIKTNLASASTTTVQEVQDSGTLGSNIAFQGGWNTSTTVQEGETYFDGLNGNGYGVYATGKSYITFSYLDVHRYNYGIYYLNSNNNTITTLSNANNNANSGICYTSSNSNNTITTLSNANNNTYFGIYYDTSSNNTIYSLSTSGNGTAGLRTKAGSRNYIFNALIGESTEVSFGSSFSDDRIFSQNHDQTANNHFIFTDGGVIFSQTAIRHTASGIAWDLQITSSNRASNYPLELSIAKIAVSANNLVTVKAWFRRSTTAVMGRLICKGKQIAGVVSDVTASMTVEADTWEELTITFTPTEAGVVEILADTYYISANGNVFVDDMSITQA